MARTMTIGRTTQNVLPRMAAGSLKGRGPYRNGLGLHRSQYPETDFGQLAFTFESGVRVSATQEQFDKVIDLEHADGDNSIAKLTVTDRLRHLGG